MSWRTHAKCRGSDPAIFYPEHDDRLDSKPVLRAKAICQSCPVARECLADAIETRERYGIRGGLTPEERGTTRLREYVSCGTEFEIENKKGYPRRYCSPECKALARERQKWESYERTHDCTGVMLDKGHGTVSKYQRGCRCASCRKAARVARRRYARAS